MLGRNMINKPAERCPALLQTAQAERRCQAAETDIQQRRANIAALKREAAELMQKNRAIKQQMVASSSWAKPELLRMYGAP